MRAPRQTGRSRPPQRVHRRCVARASLASVTRRRRGYRRFPGAGACHGQPQLTQRSPARRCRPQASTASVFPLHGQEAPPLGGPPSRPRSSKQAAAAAVKNWASRLNHFRSDSISCPLHAGQAWAAVGTTRGCPSAPIQKGLPFGCPFGSFPCWGSPRSRRDDSEAWRTGARSFWLGASLRS